MGWQQLGYLSVPVVVTVCGGIAAAYWRPSGRIESFVQHFAAGVVLGAVAVEVLPDIDRDHPSTWAALSAFAVGGALMCLLKLYEHRREHVRGRTRSPRGMLLASGADILVDGLTVGAGFAKGGSSGPLLAVGLSIELLFVGLSIAGAFAGGPRWKPIVVTTGLAGVLAAGAIGGRFVLGIVAPVWTDLALAFGIAAMLYLVTEELLVAAHEAADAPLAVAVLFAGFLAFWSVRAAL